MTRHRELPPPSEAAPTPPCLPSCSRLSFPPTTAWHNDSTDSMTALSVPSSGERRVNGSIVITHTKNDLAVGVAYPLASRIARDNADALGDQIDPYGGMGRNGAQHTPELDRTEQNRTTLTEGDPSAPVHLHAQQGFQSPGQRDDHRPRRRRQSGRSASPARRAPGALIPAARHVTLQGRRSNSFRDIT